MEIEPRQDAMTAKLLLLSALTLMSMSLSHAQQYFVSPTGNDANAGSLAKPFATLKRAQMAVRQTRGTVFLRSGTYYLSEPLNFTAEDSGTTETPVVFKNYKNEEPVISGGVQIKNLHWQLHRDGIYKTQVPADLKTEEIFVNGRRQILARYPNFDPKAKYFDGFASDAISKERAARWANPAGGYYHAMHPALWGDFTWRITGKTSGGEPTLEGGWQNNRGAAAHPEIRFVEGIFEELDSPGEWFLDSQTHTLYFLPPAGLDLESAVFEATRLRNLVTFKGDEKRPVKWIQMSGLTFRQASRTVMDTREPLLRSDWAIYRGGAIFYEGAEDCRLEDCFIDQVGGNGIFVNHYSRHVAFRGLHIANTGASGICFVGDPKSARNPLFNYSQVQDLDKIDRTPGPKSPNYPANCLVEDCLIYLTGRVEKQTAGVHIDLSQDITIRYCSIYDMPRAGINIGDGCWGGYVIEGCDIFDTVKETGDHGSFNSWGRDRFWRPNIAEVNAWIKQVPDLPFLDAVKPTILQNNRWKCDHGWDIDLDDGSSNYIIRNNLCLRGGIKNREGYRRLVENNIMVDNGFHPHVWFDECGDIFRKNIVGAEYQPAIMHRPPWGKEMDSNFLHKAGTVGTESAKRLQEQSGRDSNSKIGDAQFVNPLKGDYRVRPGSPALSLGFKNFPMDKFGVRTRKLKALARTPFGESSTKPTDSRVRPADPITWHGAKLRNIVNEGEMSAFGLPGVVGVLVLEVQQESTLDKAGLRKNDVILSVNGAKVSDTGILKQHAFGFTMITIWREQKEFILKT